MHTSPIFKVTLTRMDGVNTLLKNGQLLVVPERKFNTRVFWDGLAWVATCYSIEELSYYLATLTNWYGRVVVTG